MQNNLKLLMEIFEKTRSIIFFNIFFSEVFDNFYFFSARLGIFDANDFFKTDLPRILVNRFFKLYLTCLLFVHHL